MSAVVADAEENKIIHGLALRIDEKKRMVYGPGSEDTGWPWLILGVVALAVLFLVIGIFIVVFAISGQRKYQKMHIFSRGNVIETTTPNGIGETTLQITDKE